MQPTIQQLAIVKEQIGREPRGIAAVAVANPEGVPLVLQMRSLVNDKPFPTLYWLSSRDLSREIGRIEMTGWIKRFEEELADDAELRAAFHQQQQGYVDRRWELMDPSDHVRLEALVYTDMFNKVGIGGISSWDKVRCLHMQYAHHLAGDNLVGQRLDAEFKLNELKPQI